MICCALLQELRCVEGWFVVEWCSFVQHRPSGQPKAERRLETDQRWLEGDHRRFEGNRRLLEEEWTVMAGQSMAVGG